MSSIQEYRKPLLIAGGAVLVAAVLWLGLIAPQNSKLSSLQDKTTSLQAKETALQARLTALRSEGQKLSSNCVDLQKISVQIPSVQSPTDLDAAESSFQIQFNQLAASSGVALSQFSGFTPAGSTTGAATTTPAPSTPASSTTKGSSTPADVTAVPTTLTVQGNFGQITAFVNGLDGFPRLFVIQKFVLGFGAASTSAAGSTSNAASASASGGASGSAAAANGPPLWVGGQATSPSAGPYNLQITGSIYYTSTPNALAACTKATAAQASHK